MHISSALSMVSCECLLTGFKFNYDVVVVGVVIIVSWYASKKYSISHKQKAIKLSRWLLRYDWGDTYINIYKYLHYFNKKNSETFQCNLSQLGNCVVTLY